MPRITISQLQEEISQLQQVIKEQNESHRTLMNQIHKMQEGSDTEFANSLYYKQMQLELEQYKNYKELFEQADEKKNKEHEANIELKEQMEQLKKEIQSLNSKLRPHKHNERGAGRKSKVTKETKIRIIRYRHNGMTIQELSNQFGYSVGTIYKIITEMEGNK